MPRALMISVCFADCASCDSAAICSARAFPAPTTVWSAACSEQATKSAFLNNREVLEFIGWSPKGTPSLRKESQFSINNRIQFEESLSRLSFARDLNRCCLVWMEQGIDRATKFHRGIRYWARVRPWSHAKAQ